MKDNLQQKTRNFAIRIIGCYNYLVEQKREQVMSKQLLRCGTSIGANTRESKNAQSRMDFLNKLNIALKEADETEDCDLVSKDESHAFSLSSVSRLEQSSILARLAS